MLRTYLRIAARILARNKLYTLINIVGLALGVCVCIIIWLVDSYDLNFDRFHPDGERIYRVVVGGKPGEARPAVVLRPMPAAMRAAIPGLESMTAYFTYDESQTVRVPVQGHTTAAFQPRLPGEDRATGIILADTGWFHVFSYRWLAGNPAKALTAPFQVVLTESAAKRYFGDIPPTTVVGQELIYADSLHVHVSGVVRDWTQHSDLAYTDIISLLTINVSFLKQTHQMDDWEPRLGPDHPWPCVYVKLARGVRTGQVETQMNRIAAKRHIQTPMGPYTQRLQPLSDIHFNAYYFDFENSRKVHMPTLYALAGIALFILVLAAVNFINLATAQSLQRAKEVGVRKVLGSGKGRLVRQFLVETGVLTALALVMAVLMVWPVMRYFQDFIPSGVHFNPLTPANLLFLAGVLVTVTLAAGFYPAKVLAGYQPVETLKGSGSIRGGEKWWLRQSLVVFQFTISLVFIIVTLVIGSQIRYMLNTDYGFRSDAIVSVEGQRSMMDTSMRNMKILEQRYSGLPGIAEVIREGNPPVGRGHMGGRMTYKGRQLVELFTNVDFADEHFIPFYGMRMVAGRNIRHSDSLAEYVINETAARQLGFATPSAALGQFLGDNAVPIVGVVADYHEGSFQKPIQPMVIGHQPMAEGNLGIRLASTGKGADNVKSTLDAMEKIYKEVYPGAPFSYEFMDDSIRRLYEVEQKTASLVKLAMGLAIFISSMGLFGLSLFTAERRAAEISIRKVLGATTTNITVMLSRQYIRLVLLALIIASPIAWLLAHQWLRNFAYRVAVDVWVFVIAGLSAIGLALATVSYQSIRAALANPIRSLRSE